jgi:hypothetical protein
MSCCSFDLSSADSASSLSSFLAKVTSTLSQAEASKSAQYNFDFKAGRPLERNATSRFLWEETSSRASSTEASRTKSCKYAAELQERSDKNTLFEEMGAERNSEVCVQASNEVI